MDVVHFLFKFAEVVEMFITCKIEHESTSVDKSWMVLLLFD